MINAITARGQRPVHTPQSRPRCATALGPRQEPRSAHQMDPQSRSERARPQDQCAAQFVRVFTPGELDVDDLAEAIRSLLGPTTAPQDASSRRADPDLLLAHPRVTHVVEATQAQ